MEQGGENELSEGSNGGYEFEFGLSRLRELSNHCASAVRSTFSVPFHIES